MLDINRRPSTGNAAVWAEELSNISQTEGGRKRGGIRATITSAAANSSEEASRSTAERKAENAEVLQQCLVVAYVLCLATNLLDHLHPHMLL